MTRLPATGGGFLLGVLWMDLMFDVQASRLSGGPGDAEIDTAILRSIAAYYRRVTTEAFPMNRLIGAVMVLTIVACVVQAVRARSRRMTHVVAVLLVGLPVLLAIGRVFPNAVRLGSTADPAAVQATLARAILSDHVACFAAIVAFTLLQLRLASSTNAGS